MSCFLFVGPLVRLKDITQQKLYCSYFLLGALEFGLESAHASGMNFLSISVDSLFVDI